MATSVDDAPYCRRGGTQDGGFSGVHTEQAYLLPPTVREVLGEGHLCFFVHVAVERLDLRELEASYSDEGSRLTAWRWC